MDVVDPEGVTWRVTRRWLPWRLRLRDGPLHAGLDLAGPTADGAVVLAIVGLLLVPLAFVLAVVVAEVALALVVVAALTIARALWTRRWPIEVLRGPELVHQEAVHGWAESRERIRALADGIRTGSAPSARRPDAG